LIAEVAGDPRGFRKVREAEKENNPSVFNRNTPEDPELCPKNKFSQ